MENQTTLKYTEQLEVLTNKLKNYLHKLQDTIEEAHNRVITNPLKANLEDLHADSTK